MDMKKIPDILAGLSVVTVLAAGYVNVMDVKNGLFGLAGTQLILIGIVLGMYAMYLKMREEKVG